MACSSGIQSTKIDSRMSSFDNCFSKLFSLIQLSAQPFDLLFCSKINVNRSTDMNLNVFKKQKIMTFVNTIIHAIILAMHLLRPGKRNHIKI